MLRCNDIVPWCSTIDNEIELSRLDDGQIGGLLTVENAARVWDPQTD